MTATPAISAARANAWRWFSGCAITLAASKRSAERELTEGLLASRKHLEALLEGGEWPAALGGWRREQL
ncbi:hypothetical protein [uncultured Stenotrophomonas sp.]|uniref:hypothetical protein n=1 Tax=uncultured Stenotrophomonas sp. TaxID=165438 RepID=UPI0031BA80AF